MSPRCTRLSQTVDKPGDTSFMPAIYYIIYPSLKRRPRCPFFSVLAETRRVMSARLCPYIAGAHIPELHMASLLRHAHLEQLAHLWCELQDEAPTRSALHLGQILVLVVAWWSLGPATIPGQVLWAVATMVAASLPLALFFFLPPCSGSLSSSSSLPVSSRPSILFLTASEGAGVTGTPRL